MVTTRSQAERFDESYRALRVFWPMRWRLLWAARNDRRAGLPIGLNSATTPVLRDVLARRDDVCEHERTRYITAVEPLNVHLAQLEADVTSLQRLVAERTAEAARITVAPTQAQLTLRHAGEQTLPAALVRQRREADHRRTADAASAAQAEAQRRLDSALSEYAQVEARRQSRADVARSRVLRYVDHADRLTAIYRRALVHRHPQREALVAAWTADLHTPPAWVLADELVPSHRLHGAAA